MSQINDAIAAFASSPDTKSTIKSAVDLSGRVAVARDRPNIVRMLQHRSESIADADVKRLLVSIAEEIIDMPVQLEP